MAVMKNVKLSKDLTVSALSKADAKVVYHEIFEMQAYNKHGITIRNNDTVIDVGANIGLFSIELAKRYQGLKIYLIEPVKDIFSCLSKNTVHLAGSSYELSNYGLSANAGDAAFAFSPFLSMTSGMYNDELSKNKSKDASAKQWMVAFVEDMYRAGLLSGWMYLFLVKGLSTMISRTLMLIVLAIPLMFLILWLHLNKKRVNCRLQTFSAVLKDHGIQEAHLVKIDVEGAELDVLEGIADSDWTKINQFIIEVHDVNSRVATITRLLQQKGFAVHVDQEEWSLHKLMLIYTIYAKRLDH